MSEEEDLDDFVLNNPKDPVIDLGNVSDDTDEDPDYAPGMDSDNCDDTDDGIDQPSTSNNINKKVKFNLNRLYSFKI